MVLGPLLIVFGFLVCVLASKVDLDGPRYVIGFVGLLQIALGIADVLWSVL